MNITLPAAVAKKLDGVGNKSDFIARAVVERFEALRKDRRRQERLAWYRYTAKHPEILEDGRPDW